MKHWKPSQDHDAAPADAALEDACTPKFGEDRFGRPIVSSRQSLSKDPLVYTDPDNRQQWAPLDMQGLQRQLRKDAEALGPIDRKVFGRNTSYADQLKIEETMPDSPGFKR